MEHLYYKNHTTFAMIEFIDINGVFNYSPFPADKGAVQFHV